MLERVRSTAAVVAMVVIVALTMAGGAQAVPVASAAALAPTTAATPATTVATEVTTAPTSSPEREQLDDPETRRAMNALTAVLIGVALLLIAIAVWFWRSTRPLPPALEPLAVMSRRRFRRRPSTEREAELQAVHALKAATDPAPRAGDFLRQVRGEDG